MVRESHRTETSKFSPDATAGDGAVSRFRLQPPGRRVQFPQLVVAVLLVTVSALAHWGLIDRVIATGCPPIHTYAFDFGPFVITGSPGTPDFPVAYAPRRIVLDKILVDAAREAGAEIREGFSVDEIIREGGRVVGIAGRDKNGAAVSERAAVLVGADGRHSKVAAAVGAPCATIA